MPTPNAKIVPTWTSIQAYMLAVIALVLGVAIGYIVRGSSSASFSTSQPSSTPNDAGGSLPANPGMSGMQQPSPAQTKEMADTQAKTLIAQLSTRPEDPALLAQIGNVYYDAQQYKDAINYYEKSVKLDPKNPNVGTDLGTAYYYSGDNDKALQQLNTVLKNTPNH